MRTSILVACIAGALLLAGGGAYLVLRAPAPGPSPAPAPHAGGPAPGVSVAPPAPAPGASGQASAPTAPADCILPGPAPVPPDGGAASAADMKLGHDVIQAYVERLEAYQACRNREADLAPPGTSEQQKAAWIEQGNQAVDMAHAMADAFSVQLQRYHKHHPQ